MISKQTFPSEAPTPGSRYSNGRANETDRNSTEVNKAARNTSAQPVPRLHSATLEEAWRAHANQLLRIAQRITHNREDAEDALQDSFLRAHVHLHGFDGRSSITTWLTRIAINSALMILRKRAGVPPHFSLDEEEHSVTGLYAVSPADYSASPEAQYTRLERQAIVRQALQTLRPSIRQPLELQTTEERSTKEIAEKMGLSISATKSRIFHAKAALRKSLERKIGKVRRHSGRARQLQLSPA